jgi:hypothetical protein
MAITLRLTFDVQVPSLDDADDAALLVAKTCAPVIPASLPDASIELVGVSRLTTGLLQGNKTVDAIEGQHWRRVEHQEVI